MPLSVLLMVLLAALMHAGWNLLLKQVEDKQLFTWWALVAGTLLALPVLLLGGTIPSHIWPYAVISALAETAYFVALIRAYRIGDFSLVYPVARGAAPAVLALWAFLFLGERLDATGVFGLICILAGLVVVGSGSLFLKKEKYSPGLSALGVALTVSLFISIYSAIDGAAVHVMPAAPYTVLILGMAAAFATPVVLVRYGTHQLADAGRRHWKLILVVGGLITITYMLVLQAYALGHVSYAGALRESSVVIAAIAGWLWLGEGFGPLRTTGSVLIFTGILLIAIAK